MGLFSRKVPDDKLAEAKRLLAAARSEAQAANTCTNPDAFFAHYDAFKDNLRKLRAYERYPIFKGNLPSRDLRRAEDNEHNEINAMIQRSYVSVRDKAAKMETVPERRELFDALFTALDAHAKRLGRLNRKVVADLKEIAARQVEEMSSASGLPPGSEDLS